MFLKNYKKTILCIIFLIFSIIYTFLFSPHGSIKMIESYDILFHLGRIASLQNIFTSPVNFNYWSHIGNLTNLFYPWLTIYPAFIFSKIVGNTLIGFLMFLTLVTWLTFMSSYYFMLKFSRSELQAALFSVIYTLSFFRMANVFCRTGVAEYTAYIFMPMVFCAYAGILCKNYHWWSVLALGYSLIVLTHPLTAFMTGIMFVPPLILLLLHKDTRSWSYWLRLIKTGIKTIMLVAIITCGYWLPVEEQNYNIPMRRPLTLVLSQTAKTPLQIIQGLVQSQLWSYSLGIIMGVALLALLVFVWKDSFVYQIVAIEAIVAIILSTNLIPWQYLQNTFFNYLQFPWRFLNLATFFLAIYLSHLLVIIYKWSQSKSQILFLSAIIVICSVQVVGSATSVYQRTTNIPILPYAQSDSLTSANIEHLNRNFTQRDYYPLASNADADSLEQHQSIINGKMVKLPIKTTTNT